MTTTSSLNSEKAALRADLRARRAPEPLEAGALAAGWAEVEALPEFRRAHTVLLYMALPDEVPTLDFIRKWAGVKRFALPVVNGDSLLLREYQAERLAPGWKGILEPDASAPSVLPSEIDLALIPGVAFDRCGGRLGRGGGFYDRLLPQLGCPVIGLCRQWRIVAQVPREPWDAPVDGVVGF